MPHTDSDRRTGRGTVMHEAEGRGAMVAGMRQTLRLIASGRAACAYIARDADERMREEVSRAAQAAGVPLSDGESMAELGRRCRIAVGCAVAARTKEG